MFGPLQQILTLLESPLWRGSVQTITLANDAPLDDITITPAAPDRPLGLPLVIKVISADATVGGVLIHRLAFLQPQDIDELHVVPVKGFKNVLGLELREPERILLGIIVLEQKSFTERTPSLQCLLTLVRERFDPKKTEIKTVKTLLPVVQGTFEDFKVTSSPALPMWPLWNEDMRGK